MKQIKIGYIIKGFGIKGELKVKILTDAPLERFQKGQQLHTDAAGVLKVRSFRLHQGYGLVSFEGYADLTQAEGLLKQSLYLSVDQIKREPGVYAFDLLGLEVVDEEGHLLGHIEEVLDYPAHPVIRVQGDRVWLIPYVPAFIVDLNQDRKRLVVRRMEGL